MEEYNKISNGDCINDLEKLEVNTDSLGKEKSNSLLNNPKAIFWVLILLAIVVYVIVDSTRSTTTGNEKADRQLDQQDADRPETGNLDFNN